MSYIYDISRLRVNLRYSADQNNDDIEDVDDDNDAMMTKKNSSIKKIQ